jgi:hypothetical protein
MRIFRKAALRLARLDFRVFPCRERSKEPLISDNLKRATTDANVVNGWWASRDFNIGIATGAASNIWVLDIDGDQGEQTLLDLEATHGKLPTTATVITGAGRHLYWRWSSGVEIRNIQCRDDMAGLDVRGEGGYVITAPSIHPSGHTYRWVDVNAAFAAAPAWLIGLVTRRGPHQQRAGSGDAARGVARLP